MVAISGEFRLRGGFRKGGNQDGIEEKGTKKVSSICIEPGFR
jgi:hypothetical protein